MERQQTIIAAVVIIAIIAIGSFIYISANTHNTKIEVLDSGTLQNGDYITILLTDEYRNPYPGEVVYIKILDDSGWAHKYNITTDEEGRGSVQLQTLENGNYTIHCSYNGTLFNKASTCSEPLKINDGYN